MIEGCLFEGSVTGESKVGGILGYYGNSYDLIIKGCKVDANVTASNGSAGGIVGSGNAYVSVYGCYSAGNISATADVSGIATSGDAYLSYSVMNNSSSSFYGIGKNMRGQDCATTASRDGSGTNFKSNCTDITTFLQECYSSYAGYWNFKNTWTWKGTINGKEVSVSCPRLAWEQ